MKQSTFIPLPDKQHMKSFHKYCSVRNIYVEYGDSAIHVGENLMKEKDVIILALKNSRKT